MPILRTKAVELSVIPAIAYKQKLPSGGAGVKLLRLDSDLSAVSTLDKRTGEALPYGKFDEKLFPSEAFDEAIELTSGLPYSSRGNICLTIKKQDDEIEETEQLTEETAESFNMVESDEYISIVERYSDEKGKLNYALMNKDFIQFTSKSKVVADMVANKAHTDDILLFVIKSRAAFIANKKDSLDEKEVKALIDTLNEIDPRSAFKELKNHINRLLARR